MKLIMAKLVLFHSVIKNGLVGWSCQDWLGLIEQFDSNGIVQIHQPTAAASAAAVGKLFVYFQSNTLIG